MDPLTSSVSWIVSLLLKTGLFKSVNTVEPKAPPADGVTAAIYFANLKPVGAVSGLDSGSALLELTCRIYTNLLQTPADATDPKVIQVTSAVIKLFFGDLDLDGTVRNVDVFGEQSGGLTARAGHVDVGGTLFRCVDISVPLLINDMYTEVI